MQRRIRHFFAAGAALALLWPARGEAQPPPDEPPPDVPEEPEPEPPPEEPLVPPDPEPQPEPQVAPAVQRAPRPPAKAVEKKPEAPEPQEQPVHKGRFTFGSYGRVIAATDVQGRPPRDADIVAHGSRLDHENYVELELRRDDHWFALDADTRFVATLALGHPVFHYDGEFDVRLAVRNLYAEERDIGLEGLSFWAGSRMLRGDDIYLLDFWPLDNLNTLGAGLGYEAVTKTKAHVHLGLGQPNNPFYKQEAERPLPLNQFGTATVAILDRIRWIGSARVEQIFPVGDDGGGLKLVGYGEVHQVPGGQRETAQAGVYQEVPRDDGWVVGGQFGAFLGQRDTHVNVFARYARGLAAYGEFAAPTALSLDRTASDAREILIALGGNFEIDRVAVMLGGYFRSFRNASSDLDFGDVDEGIVIARPAVFFTDWLGLAVEGSFQAQQRGVLADVGLEEDEPPSTNPRPLTARMSRLGVVPFVTPAGRGSYSRPIFWFIYVATFRDEGARELYPVNDVFRVRDIDHYFGVGAEWWFGSTSYGDEE